MAFKPQLAEDANKLKEPLQIKELLFSHKLDGIRAVTKFNSTLTRSLKPLPNTYWAEQLARVQNLDGELIFGEPTDDNVYTQTYSAVMTQQGEPTVRYYVFDDLSRLDLPFEDRLDILMNRKDLPEFVVRLPQLTVENQEALTTLYQAALLKGVEGLMGRKKKSMYKFGRCTVKSQDSLKFKPYSDDEAVVVSAYEAMENTNEAFTDELGRTARSTHAAGLVGKGMLGGFVCRDVKSGVEFSVAPGKLRHEERTALWVVKDKLPGHVLTYRHLTVGVVNKPRHGRFLRWFNPVAAAELLKT